MYISEDTLFVAGVVLGLLAIILWIYAFFSVLFGQNRRITKILLLVFFIVFPLVGLIYPFVKSIPKKIVKATPEVATKALPEVAKTIAGNAHFSLGIFRWLIKK